MNIIISKSPKPSKTYVATVNGEKDVYFGDSRYQLYETHHNDIHKQNYIKRHEKR